MTTAEDYFSALGTTLYSERTRNTSIDEKLLLIAIAYSSSSVPWIMAMARSFVNISSINS